jgi:hypothetical protein
MFRSHKLINSFAKSGNFRALESLPKFSRIYSRTFLKAGDPIPVKFMKGNAITLHRIKSEFHLFYLMDEHFE